MQQLPRQLRIQTQRETALSMCIPLVEDEVLVRLMLAEKLQDAGLAVREADHGDHAAILIDDHAPAFSLLVTDRSST